MIVSWSVEALDQVEAIRERIASASSRRADEIVGLLFDRGRQLAFQPFLGPLIVARRAAGLRESLVKPYRMIYRVVDDRLEILAVIHAARRLPKDLGDGA